MRHNNISLYFPAAEIAIWLRDGIVTGWGVHLKITLLMRIQIFWITNKYMTFPFLLFCCSMKL